MDKPRTPMKHLIIFTFKKTAKIAVSSTITNYKSGILGYEYVFEKTDIPYGCNVKKTKSSKDIKRVKKMNNKASFIFQKCRKNLKQISRGYNHTKIQTEVGEAYASGNF